MAINKLQGGPENFTASSGWLENFKKSYSIHIITSHGESLSADKKGAKKFAKWFSDYIDENNLTLDQIYNADESGLVWKSMPRRTLVDRTEKKQLEEKNLRTG